MRKIISCLLILLLLLSCGAQAEGITYTGKIVGGKLHLRAAPDSSAKIIKTYAPGTEVSILENDGVWCRVKLDGKEGYMKAEYLEITADYPHLGWAATPRDGAVLNLYEKPDEESPLIRQYISGLMLETIERSGDFSKVRAGREIGYVKTALLSAVEGEFAPDLSFSENAASLTIDQFKNGKKELGASKTRAKDSGDFPYSLTYPVLNIPEADEKIDRFIGDTLSRFEADAAARHAGESARYDVDYTAQMADDRYAGIVLMGQYTAGKTCLNVFCALNVDLEKQTLLDLSACFPDPLRLNYAIQAQLSARMPKALDGYTGRVDDRILEYAALTAEGMEIYLSEGSYLPLSQGNVVLSIPYLQFAESMQIESPFIKSHKRTIDPAKPMIALTFDDGPSEETDRILNVLAQYDARATFCVQGMNVEPFGSTVQKAVALGNEIASHTWNHPKLTEKGLKTIRSQLERTNEAVRAITGGYQVKALRPPYGSYNKNVKTVCKDLNMVIVTWQIDTEDWKTRSTAKTYNAILKGAKKNGAIILCHDLYTSTASAIEKAVPELAAQGIQMVTVSELLSFHKEGAVPGKVYSHLDPENIRTE